VSRERLFSRRDFQGIVAARDRQRADYWMHW
jgi:hypothetical protein